MFDNDSFSEQLEINNKDIYKNFLGLLSSCNYEMIMFDIFKHQEFNTHEHENTIEEEQDFKLLEMIHDEVEIYIDKFDISNISYREADASMSKIFSSFNESKLEDKDLASMLKKHKNSNYMDDILKILLLNSLSVRAFHECFYLLASNKHNQSRWYYNKLKELAWSETPYEKHINSRRSVVVELAEQIWLMDKNKILLRKQVAKIIKETLTGLNLRVSQVDGWLKNSKVVPDEILERYKNHEYGNSKSIVRDREKLISEIALTLNSLYCDSM